MHKAKLSTLISNYPQIIPGDFPEVIVTGITLDSRQVEPGNLFVALEGGSTDGHLFIPEAIDRGAAAVVGTQSIGEVQVPYLMVADGRHALAYLSAA